MLRYRKECFAGIAGFGAVTGETARIYGRTVRRTGYSALKMRQAGRKTNRYMP